MLLKQPTKTGTGRCLAQRRKPEPSTDTLRHPLLCSGLRLRARATISYLAALATTAHPRPYPPGSVPSRVQPRPFPPASTAVVELTGIEPVTPCLQSRCSPS